MELAEFENFSSEFEINNFKLKKSEKEILAFLLSRLDCDFNEWGMIDIHPLEIDKIKIKFLHKLMYVNLLKFDYSKIKIYAECACLIHFAQCFYVLSINDPVICYDKNRDTYYMNKYFSMDTSCDLLDYLWENSIGQWTLVAYKNFNDGRYSSSPYININIKNKCLQPGRWDRMIFES